MEVAKTHQDQLPRIKKNIKEAYDYFYKNYERFNKFKKFVFESTLTDSDRQLCAALKRPEIEFNILEPFISRLLGEFSKQEPSIEVRADDGDPVNPKVIDAVEGHIRHIFFDANNNGCQYEVYKDTLSGGFSAIKVWTEYASVFDLNQVIKIGKVYDPTLTGFDPLAKSPHKGDGRFCFELYPKTKEQFKEEYPHINIDPMKFTRNMEGFSFCFSSQKQDVLLIAEYYEKKNKKVKIVQLSNKMVMLSSEYKKMLTWWEKNTIIEQAPVVVREKYDTIETICRYLIIDSQVIEYKETNFNNLPIVFVDGSSIILKDNENSIRQMTRPYVFHAEGTQKLKNLAGQSLANELENIIQSKFIIPKEAIPSEQMYLDAITNFQQASTIVYNAFKDNDPNVPIPPPREINRMPCPPEITGAFALTDQLTQTILGSYDASLGINDNQLSGIAIVEGATQSNAAAMPYIVGNLQAYEQVANIIVDLIPKYYATERTIPVTLKDGKKDFVKINQKEGLSINYDENALQVKVEAGVNFAVQKSRALQQIIALMQASPIFAQFMNEKGLGILLDNIEIRGVDILKVMSEQFMQEMQQQKAQQAQMTQQAQQNDPMLIAATAEKSKAETAKMKLQIDAQQAQMDAQMKQFELSIKKMSEDTKRMQVMIEAGESRAKIELEGMKYASEEAKAQEELDMRHDDMEHRHSKDYVDLHHKISSEMARGARSVGP